MENSDCCSICQCDYNIPVKLECGHTFCSMCIITWFRKGNNTCPYCRSHPPPENNIRESAPINYGDLMRSWRVSIGDYKSPLFEFLDIKSDKEITKRQININGKKKKK